MWLLVLERVLRCVAVAAMLVMLVRLPFWRVLLLVGLRLCLLIVVATRLGCAWCVRAGVLLMLAVLRRVLWRVLVGRSRVRSLLLVALLVVLCWLVVTVALLGAAIVAWLRVVPKAA